MRKGGEIGFWKKAACVTAVGAAAFGLTSLVRAIWPEKTEYCVNRYVQMTIEREEELEKIPVFKQLKGCYDWLAVNVHGQAGSYEELEAKRKEFKQDLNTRINDYEKRGE